MRDTTIARNYAEALLALARKVDGSESWGLMINGVADAIANDTRLSNFLAAPQIAASDKNRIIAKAFSGALPPTLVRFLQNLVVNRRQTLIPQMSV